MPSATSVDAGATLTGVRHRTSYRWQQMNGDEWTWWARRDALQRFVSDLVAAEFAGLAPGRPVPAQPWTAALRLDAGGVGADSLDRLKLATALGEAIHLSASGIDDSLLADETIGAWVATAARSLAAYSAELTFRTSGSTGRPKWCVHTLADLNAEIAVLASRLGDCRRIVSAVPSHHIYGFLFTILLPAHARVPVVDVRSSSPARLASLLTDGDVVIGHPDFWAAFARSVPTVAPGVRGVTSTAPCPSDVARAALASGLGAFVEVYGSSETAGIGWRDDPQAAYELFPYWRRGDDDGALVRVAADGRDRSARLPDRVDWADARHIRPMGRREGAVQVGGQNVFPEHVRAILREHPGVADAAVRLMRADEGDRLKAFVVPSEAEADTTALTRDLWSWIEARLAVPQRPRSIVFGPALPVGAFGKSADWPIVAAGPPDGDRLGA